MKRRDLETLAHKLSRHLASYAIPLQDTARIVDERYVRLESLPTDGLINFYFAAPIEAGRPIPAYAEIAFFNDDFSLEERHRGTEPGLVPPPWARYAVCLNVMQLSKEENE